MFECKVADFGLSRFLEDNLNQQQMTKGVGTASWSAPEVVRWQEYTEKADVYSFGILLWELWVREVPYDGLTRDQVILSVAMENARPKIPPNKVPVNWRKLIEICWETEQSKRPSFLQIRSSLSMLLDFYLQKQNTSVSVPQQPILPNNPLSLLVNRQVHPNNFPLHNNFPAPPIQPQNFFLPSTANNPFLLPSGQSTGFYKSDDFQKNFF